VSGQRVTVDKAFGLAPVYSAVSIISEAVGMLPFKVYRSPGDDEVVVASDHRRGGCCTISRTRRCRRTGSGRR
jgi:phage portal protein BeeE